MSGFCRLWLRVFVCAILTAAHRGYAAEPVAQTAGDDLISTALAAEVEGDSEKAAAMLEQARAQSPDSDRANWYGGRVRYLDRWVPLTELEQCAADPKLLEYRRQRQAGASIADHWRLAAWCKRQGLTVEYLGQLHLVLAIKPNHAAARQALGYLHSNGRWMTQQDAAAAREDARRLMQGFQKWEPKLAGLRDKLRLTGSEAEAQASAELAAIDDAGAILPMELVLSAWHEDYARQVLDVLNGMNQTEATISLARHAVYADSVNTRREAIEILKRRSPSEYMPVLLSSLSKLWELHPVDMGVACRQNYLVREGFDSKQVHIITSRVFLEEYIIDNAGVRPPWVVLSFNLASNRSTEVQAGAVFDIQQAQIAEAVADANDQVDQVNSRVTSALSELTGEDLGTESESWWNYWVEQSDSYQPEKPYQTTQTYTPPTSIPHVTMMSCFVAGTPVWTSTGPRPIEQLTAGDSVVAQDVTTGELSLRPIQRTTVRPPSKALRLTSGEQSITCTPGHRFWVVGRGWVKAKSLSVGDRLYGAMGSQRLDSIEDAAPETTYNLIVDGSHSYFVGVKPLLVHDNTAVVDLQQALPGLTAR